MALVVDSLNEQIRAATSHRRLLLDIFLDSVAAVDGRRRVYDHLTRHPLDPPVHVIAIGKAATRMALGAHEALGGAIVSGLVITKHGHAEPLPWPVREAGHPWPDEASLAAGGELLGFVDGLHHQAQVLLLLSGGASALVEALPAGVTLSDLRAVNDWLLGSGRDIVRCNRVRKRLSLIKGGRLARRLAPRRVTCLAISDVPGDDPRVIGSGLLTPDDTVLTEPIDDAPRPLQELLARAPALPAVGDAEFGHVSYAIIARSSDAIAAAVAAARRRGVSAQAMPTYLQGEATAAGVALAQALLKSPAPRLLVWGGETTVTLPPSPGRGGRNQSLALAAATLLAGHGKVYLLAAGTDGSDGPTEDAGALVDGGTIARGRDAGLDAQACLGRADAGSFLAASGDLIQTGPTGTNVMDLVMGWRCKNMSA